MNEIKLSTQIKSQNEQKLTIKFDASALEQLGVSWSRSDTLRVKCYKKEGRVVLKKVARKYDRQVAYNITSMGNGNYSHSLGIYVTQKRTRFDKLTQTHMSTAAARKISHNEIEIYLPREIFQTAQ